LYGEAKLCRGDLDADVHIKKFIANFKGTNYIKNANQRLWWHYIIHDNETDAKKYFEAINGYGSIVVDEDKYALDTYQKKQWPNKQLLKSRLLFDGGYYTRALQCIVDLDLNSLVQQNERVEFMYRLGRIYQRMENNAQAIKSFENAIKFGATIPEYYAASACYEMGKIYETQKMYTVALTYFEKSKTFKNHSYRTSLNQKAKAAINRVEAKIKSENKLKS
jgi:tetratricopeptide (TPR) repeat protein